MPMGAQENKTKQCPQKEWGRKHHTPPRLCTEERSFRFGQTPRCEAIPGYRSLASTCRGGHFLCLSSHYCLSSPIHRTQLLRSSVILRSTSTALVPD